MIYSFLIKTFVQNDASTTLSLSVLYRTRQVHRKFYFLNDPNRTRGEKNEKDKVEERGRNLKLSNR